MSNGYKQALQRFEDAVRVHAVRDTCHPNDWLAIEREYEEAKRQLVTKLNYRSMSQGKD